MFVHQPENTRHKANGSSFDKNRSKSKTSPEKKKYKESGKKKPFKAKDPHHNAPKRNADKKHSKPVPLDLDSPFAALAVLKEQLKSKK